MLIEHFLVFVNIFSVVDLTVIHCAFAVLLCSVEVAVSTILGKLIIKVVMDLLLYSVNVSLTCCLQSMSVPEVI